jgi:hypothetical protein
MSVVISGAAAVAPVATRQQASAQVARSPEIWRARLARVNEQLVRLGLADLLTSQVDPAPAVYFDDPVLQVPVRCLDKAPDAFTLTSERINLHLLEALLEQAGPLRNPVHLSHGDPADDLSKQTFLATLGVPLQGELVEILMDPFRVFSLVGDLKRPSVSRVVEASASGTTALLQAAERVRSGAVEAAVMLTSSAKTIPIPWETARSGHGPDRTPLPFSEGSRGHFGSEGGVGLLLCEERAARRDGRPILGRLSGWATGTIGSAVVNRTVVADVVLRCLAAAGVPADTPVLVELYGRGNLVDDSAELSAVERVRKTYPEVASAYLKGDTHYVTGAHGLQGLVRLLTARRRGESVGSLAWHPGPGPTGRRSMPHLVADPSGYTKILSLTYSMHGTCAAVLVDLDAENGGPR